MGNKTVFQPHSGIQNIVLRGRRYAAWDNFAPNVLQIGCCYAATKSPKPHSGNLFVETKRSEYLKPHSGGLFVENE
jgi:hypothetical protein